MQDGLPKEGGGRKRNRIAEMCYPAESKGLTICLRIGLRTGKDNTWHFVHSVPSEAKFPEIPWVRDLPQALLNPTGSRRVWLRREQEEGFWEEQVVTPETQFKF